MDTLLSDGVRNMKNLWTLVVAFVFMCLIVFVSTHKTPNRTSSGYPVSISPVNHIVVVNDEVPCNYTYELRDDTLWLTLKAK